MNTHFDIAHDGLAVPRSPGSGLVGIKGQLFGLSQSVVNVRLDGSKKWLLWDEPESGGRSVTRVELDGLLDRFCRILTADDVVKFAKKRGPLFLCADHGLPYVHNRRSRSDSFGFSTGEPVWHETFCTSMRAHETPLGIAGVPDERELAGGWSSARLVEPGATYCEPINRWLDFVDRARSLLKLMYVLDNGETGSSTDWLTIWPGQGEERFQQPDMADTDQIFYRKLMVGTAVNTWMRIGAAQITHPWPLSRNLVIEGSLFGSIGVQLAGAIGGTRRMGVCDYCKNPYTRLRRPKEGQRNSCDRAECKKELRNEQQAEYRSRKRREEQADG